MRTFTYSDAKSHKFWNVEVRGNALTVTYGRVGSAGQTQTKTFADEARARKEQDKLVQEKLAKGYVETTPSAKPQPANVREALEEALVENPDDLAAHMAYADYLTEQGDPRGEYIRTQLALEDEGKALPERKQFQQRESDLLRQHGREWLGELAPFFLDQKGIHHGMLGLDAYEYQMWRGWLYRLECGRMSLECARALARAPQARLLRELIIKGQEYDVPADTGPIEGLPEGSGDTPTLFPLVRSRFLGNVRVLQLGEQEKGDSYFNCRMDGAAAVGIVKVMPRLEELYLLAHEVDTEQLFGLKTLDLLRVLQVYHMDNYPLARLANNPSLGQLTDLLLFPHNLEEGDPFVRLADLRAVVRSPHLTGLRRLKVSMADAGDPGCKEVVESGVLKRLRHLDLSYGRVSDRGAATLAACPDLRNLESLNLTGNCLTAKGLAALKATGVNLLAGGQWESSGEEEDDYQHYLYQGDIE
jgi:uncharacterized protein (TIGR02996 family)